ncbi:MAG: hypothetical protein GX660_25605 [Clostridiaceae bacterium]|nr:hypothetical protein [Clostridiaceae bacterium]
MENENIQETIVSTANVMQNNGILKIAGIGAGVVLVGGLIYKFAAKPILAKLKSKKAENQQEEMTEEEY